MKDPLRKPRTLRFKVTRALLISAPLVGSMSCGDPQISNPVEPLPEVNVIRPGQETPMVEAEGEMVDMEVDMEADVEVDMEADMADMRTLRTNPGPRSKMIIRIER